MRFKSTFIFSLVVGGVIGLAVYDFKSKKKQDDAMVEASKVYSLKAEAISGLKLRRGGDEIELTKNQGRWQLTKPVVDLADETSLNTYLNSLLLESAKELTFADGKQVVWSDYFLEPPGAEISLVSDSGSASVIQISRSAAYDGSYFLRRGDQLLLGSSSWSGFAEKMPSHFRDKKVYRSGVIGKVTAAEIELRSKRRSGRLKLESKQDKWSAVGAKWALDDSKVKAWIQSVENLAVQDFIGEEKSSASLKKYGLDKPEARLRFVITKEGGGEASWEMLASSLKGQGEFMVVSTSSGSALGKIASGTFGQVEMLADDFRDHREPFRVAVDEVQEVNLVEGSTQVVVRKEGSDWKFVSSPQGKELSVEGLQGFLNSLEAMEAREFLGAKPGKGLSPAKTSLILKGGDGQNLLEVRIGDSYEVGGEKYYYARTNKLDETLAVREAQLLGLKAEALFKETSKE